MSKKIILCDLDSVVVNLLGPWLSQYNTKFNRDIKVSDIHTWAVEDCVPHGKAVYSIMEQPGFFRHLPLLPGAKDGLLALLEKHDVYLVSAGSKAALSEKGLWLEEHLSFMHNRTFFTNGKTPKGLIKGDVLIDDGPHNLIDFKQRNPNGIAVAAYYKYTAPALHVVDAVAPFQDSSLGWGLIVSYLNDGEL